MNDDFLHRIRVQPSPEFLARLKARLDRQGPVPHPRARLLRSLVAGLLVGASALALASLALRGELGGFHWDGWGRTQVSGEGVPPQGGAAANSPAARDVPAAWSAHNPWAAAPQPSSRAAGRQGVASVGPVVAIPQSAPVAPNATAAEYGGGAALLAPAPSERLNIVVAAHADFVARNAIAGFVKQGYNQPALLVAPEGSALADFCRGNSLDFIVPARRMTPAEIDGCARLGAALVEVKIGSEVVVFGRSRLYGTLSLTPRDVFLALARTIPDVANPGETVPNRNATWNDVNPALPLDRIQVLGPALGSPQGQAFLALIMEAGCDTFASLATLQGAAREQACRTLREDGVYVDAGPPIGAQFIQRLEMVPTAVGVLSAPLASGNADALLQLPIDGVAASAQSVADGSYTAARTMYLYVNRDHARRLSSMRSFLLDYLAAAWGPGGPTLLLRSGEPTEIRTRALIELGFQP